METPTREDISNKDDKDFDRIDSRMDNGNSGINISSNENPNPTGRQNVTRKKKPFAGKETTIRFFIGDQHTSPNKKGIVQVNRDSNTIEGVDDMGGIYDVVSRHTGDVEEYLSVSQKGVLEPPDHKTHEEMIQFRFKDNCIRENKDPMRKAVLCENPNGPDFAANDRMNREQADQMLSQGQRQGQGYNQGMGYNQGRGYNQGMGYNQGQRQGYNQQNLINGRNTGSASRMMNSAINGSKSIGSLGLGSLFGSKNKGNANMSTFKMSKGNTDISTFQTRNDQYALQDQIAEKINTETKFAVAELKTYDLNDVRPEDKPYADMILKFLNDRKSKEIIPKDITNEDDASEIAKRTLSFTTQRLGLSLSNQVDRLIFKNQDYVELFKKDYLFNHGYFGNEEEYRNLKESVEGGTFLMVPNKSPAITKGTTVYVKINGDYTMKGRINSWREIKGKKYYWVEYKTNLNTKKSLGNSIKSATKSLAGLTEFAEIEDALKQNKIIISQDNTSHPSGLPNVLCLNDVVQFNVAMRPFSGGQIMDRFDSPPVAPSSQNHISKPPNTEIREVCPNPYYKVFPYPIPEDLVKKNMSTSIGDFYKLNEEINIPFKNPKMFTVFHILKYTVKKAFSVGRMKQLYSILKSMKYALNSDKDILSAFRKNKPPKELEKIIKENRVDETGNKEIGELFTTIYKKEDEPPSTNTTVRNQETKRRPGGMMKGSDDQRVPHNKTMKRGGLASSITEKGRIEVIIDKLRKYIYCKNLSHAEEYVALLHIRLLNGKTFPGGKLPDDHLLKYAEIEQRRFLMLGILYYENKSTLWKDIFPKGWKTLLDSKVIRSSFPYFDFNEEQNNKQITNEMIDSEIKTAYSKKSTYEMVKKLADLALNNRIRGNNRILDKIFDYSYKRMVYYRIKEMHDGANSQVDKQFIGRFYVKIYYSIIMSAHFTCTTAVNVTLGVLSNPLASFGIVIPVNLPPIAKTLTQANTPQCYISSLFATYMIVFFPLFNW